MPEATGDAFSDLFDDFRDEESVELWQVLKLHDCFRKALELARWDPILRRSLIRLQNFDSLADKQDLLA